MFNFLNNVKGEILRLFFVNEVKNFYLTEIAKKLHKKTGEVQRHLNQLVAEGVLQDDYRGKMRFFYLNKEYSFYRELKNIMEKKFGLKNKLTDFMVSLRGVKAAFIFGSFASSKETNLSDLDLMIVGNPNQDKLIDGIKKIEDMFGREINYHVYKEKEIEDGLKKHNKFLLEIFSSPIIILTGYINEFKSITRK